MIVRNLTLAILIGLLLGGCCAQAPTGKPIEPANIGVVFLLDSSNQKLTPLPKELWKTIGKPGWTTTTGTIQVEGETSSLRIKTGNKTEFVFNVGSPESVRLYQFTRKKNKREVELVKIKGAFRKQRDMAESIPTDITRYGDSSYKLVPQSPLSPGEYGLDVGGNLFTFGVDQ